MTTAENEPQLNNEWLCPRCIKPVQVRIAPSGAARLVRHTRAHDWSCTGTGWEVEDD